MTRIALMGVGRMGTVHAKNIAANPRLSLAWVSDSVPARAECLAAEHGARAGLIEDVLKDPGVSGAIVTTSTDSLLETSLRFLRAGKAVFSEKPLSLSLSALLDADELRGENLPPLFVGFNRRFDPHICRLREQILAGEIGALETLHIISHDPALPAVDFIPRSGGLFKDFTVHDFDTAAWLLDDPIRELFAVASCLIDPMVRELGDSDTAKLLLKTRGGKICFISNSRRTNYGYDQRIEAFGSRGSLRMENIATTAVSRWGLNGCQAAPFRPAFPERYAEAYRRELDHFADILETGCTPETDFRAAIHALRLAEAASQSAESESPVTIPAEDF